MTVNSSTDLVIGETGIVNNFNHNSQTIFFDHNYDNPVIFTQPLSYEGSQPAIIRIEDVQSDRFTASIQEPSNLDGWHINESFSYLVLEKGAWQLEDNTLLEVGTENTDLLGTEGWEDVSFANNFADDPLVFSQVQTNNDSDFVRTRQRNTNNNGFQISMEEEEAVMSSGHGMETLGWFAISAGSGNWSQNNYLAGTTGDSVDHKWHTVDFGNNFSQPPIFLASIATYDGSDPSGLRSRNLGGDRVNIKIEEDTTRDSETWHTTEAVNFFAIADNHQLRGFKIEEVVKPDINYDLKSCQLNNNIRAESYTSTIWTSKGFDGNACREITGEGTNSLVTVDIEEGGFDAGVARVGNTPGIRVDDVESFGKISSTVDVDLDGSGMWWVGPKIDFWKYRDTSTIDGWYENYVIENASRSPQEYHERLTNRGTYLGQTNHDGSTYNHYLATHNNWHQFFAVRQNYRSSGSVSMDTIIDMWRNNGLPNNYIGWLKTNIETSGEVDGTVEMSNINIPSW